MADILMVSYFGMRTCPLKTCTPRMRRYCSVITLHYVVSAVAGLNFVPMNFYQSNPSAAIINIHRIMVLQIRPLRAAAEPAPGTPGLHQGRDLQNIIKLHMEDEKGPQI